MEADPLKNEKASHKMRSRTNADSEVRRQKREWAKMNPRVVIGKDNYARWMELKRDMKCKSYSEVSGLLLDAWFNRETVFCKRCGIIVSKEGTIYPPQLPSNKPAGQEVKKSDEGGVKQTREVHEKQENLESRETPIKGELEDDLDDMDDEFEEDVGDDHIDDNDGDDDYDVNNKTDENDSRNDSSAQQDLSLRDENGAKTINIVMADTKTSQDSTDQNSNKQKSKETKNTQSGTKITPESEVLSCDCAEAQNNEGKSDVKAKNSKITIVAPDLLEPIVIEVNVDKEYDISAHKTDVAKSDECSDGRSVNISAKSQTDNSKSHAIFNDNRNNNHSKTKNSHNDYSQTGSSKDGSTVDGNVNHSPALNCSGDVSNVDNKNDVIFQTSNKAHSEIENRNNDFSSQTDTKNDDSSSSDDEIGVIFGGVDANNTCSPAKQEQGPREIILDLSCMDAGSSDEELSRTKKSSRKRRSTIKCTKTTKKQAPKSSPRYDDAVLYGRLKLVYEQEQEGEVKEEEEKCRRSGRLKEKGKISFKKTMDLLNQEMDDYIEASDSGQSDEEEEDTDTSERSQEEITSKEVKQEEEENNQAIPIETEDQEETDKMFMEAHLGTEKTLRDPDYDSGSGGEVSESSENTDDEDYVPDEYELNDLRMMSQRTKREKTEKPLGRKRMKKIWGDDYFPDIPKQKRKKHSDENKRVVYPNIEVKLQDHKDKYERTVYMSQAKSDRCVDEKLKSYERYTCKLCNGDFNTTDELSLENHIKLHLQGRLTCNDCGKVFSRLKMVQVHNAKYHPKETYMCEHCAKDFGYLKTLQRHLAKDHGEVPFNCTKCTDKFVSHEERKVHMYEKHPGSAVKCPKCGVVFLGKMLKKEHVGSTACLRRAKEIPNNTQCEHCGKMIGTMTLAAHVRRAHHKIHVHRCEWCDYTTNSEYNISHHRMTHTGERPHRCELCNFSCIYLCQLKSHMRTHTGDKPYKCDQCSFASAWNVQLKGHKKAHDSPAKVDCVKCNITFKDEKGLGLHNKKEHSQEDTDSMPSTSYVPKKRSSKK